MVFALPHLGETYSSVLPVLMVPVLFLDLAYGPIMQKTNSLLGTVVFHAGSDIPVVLGIFTNLQ
jgi:membrane protease YdiL (CAAX protease family)